MKKSRLASTGLVALAYGSIMLMSAADAPRGGSTAAAHEAAKQASKTAKALNRHDSTAAVAAAEQAVAFAPSEPGYRMLLGQSYMQAGRFASAGQAFADVLSLDGGNGPNAGRAALNLALTQIAAGDWQAARRTLGSHTEAIPAADRGLALALAGDTEAAVALLTQVARSPAASPKVRQNLALAYALAGQWQMARVVASADMSPADVDARIEQWAAFAQPRAASDQVASLLGVRPVVDGGQPTALALFAPTQPISVAQVEAPAPVAAAATPVAAPATEAAAPIRVATVVFGPRREVVQALPVATLSPVSGPIKVAAAGKIGARFAAAARSTAVTGGKWFVQLGAYESAGVARDDWGRARRRYAAFGDHTPQGATVKVGAATYYRLSVGGFARADADQACRTYRARGGTCFVRQSAGEQVASWATGGTRVAARQKVTGIEMAAR